jgi:hypothetical protein
MVMPILHPTKTATLGGDGYMADGNLLRFGGVSGLLAVVSIIPAYLVGYPDAPGSLLEAQTYFDAETRMLVFSNGVLPLFHVFFFLLFLGVLYGMLRSAGGEARVIAEGLPAVALAGGIVFATLSAAGFTAEIFYPAVLQRFGELRSDTAFVLVSLTLSSWLYHYCQIGTSAMVFSTSLVAVGTRVLPGWLALAGFVVAILAFLHFLFPLLVALVGLVWVAVVSAVMLTRGSRGPRTRRTR